MGHFYLIPVGACFFAQHGARLSNHRLVRFWNFSQQVRSQFTKIKLSVECGCAFVVVVGV